MDAERLEEIREYLDGEVLYLQRSTLEIVLAEVERLRGVAEVALAQVGTTCRRPTNITDTRGRVGHPCGEPAKCLPCALAALEAKP